MLPDIRPGAMPEAPTDKELINKIETCPQLDRVPYKKRLVGKDNMVFEPRESVIQREQEDRPIEASVLAQALSLSGIPADFIEARWSRIANHNPSHQKSPDDTLYIVKEAFPGLSSPNSEERALNTIGLGDLLIIKSLENAPTPRDLPPEQYKDITMRTLDDFLSYVERQQKANIDPSRFSDAKDMMRSLFETNIRIVAIGAKIHVIFDGQTLETSEFIAGHNFSTNITHILANPAAIRFRNLLINAQFIQRQYPTRTIDNLRRVEGVLRSITGVDFSNRDRLLAAYLGSMIPHCYVNSRPKRLVDPTKYPQ